MGKVCYNSAIEEACTQARGSGRGLGACRIYESSAYAVYKHCMYLPTKGKFLALADGLLANPTTAVWAYWMEDRLAGTLALRCVGDEAEIVGIAVDQALRRQGIGSRRVREVMARQPVSRLVAETDGDAVGCYERCGFSAKGITKVYDGKPFIRYSCVQTA